VALEQAWVHYGQRRLEDATSGVLCALEIFERVGALREQENCKGLLLEIEQETKR
jgi:hypothetical protein